MEEPFLGRIERLFVSMLRYGFPLLCVVCVSSCAQFRHRCASRPCARCGAGVGPEYGPAPGLEYSPAPGPAPVGSVSPQPQRSAALRLMLNGPLSAGLGEEIRFTLDVSNSGGQEATGVVVRYTVPDGLRYVDATPPGRSELDVQGGEVVVWELGTLGGGQRERLTVRFEAQGPGRLLSLAEVTSAESLRADARAATEVSEARLRVEVTAPRRAMVGQSVTFDITVINAGDVAATNIKLLDTFDDGLVYDFRPPSGAVQERTGTVGIGLRRLEAGQRQSYPLTLRGTKPGVLRNQVTVTADGGLEASAEARVEFQHAALNVSVVGPQWRFEDRPAEFNISVTNSGQAPLRGVELVDYVPAEMSYLGASQGGIFRGRTVEWDLGELAPGETVRVWVELNAEVVVAETVNRVSVRCEGAPEAQDEATLEIRARPAGLDTYMFDLEDLVPVGKEVTYEIRVQNNGGEVARDVRVQAMAPAQMQLVPDGHVAPPGMAVEQQGNRITFGPADLEAGGRWQIHVRARAMAADPAARFRVQIEAGGMLPIIEEEPTTIVAPEASP